MSQQSFDPIVRIRGALIALLVLMIVGISGYVYIEDYSALDAFYMTVITLGTVGFSEVKPLDPFGKVFTAILILVGLGIVAYAATSLAQIILEGKIFRQRRREKKVNTMKDHVIVCGYGRIGRRIVSKLLERDVTFVIIEKDPSVINELEEKRFPYIEGNASEDETLLKTNIGHARCLVTALNSNADNVYVTLTARSMNPDLYIIARSSDSAGQMKLKHAGATRVISPYEIGGAYIANAILRPNVVDFMEVVSEVQSDRRMSLEIDEIVVNASSHFVKKALRETPLRSELNIIVLSIKDANGSVAYNPSPDRTLEVGDTLICIGFMDKLDQLAKMLA